MLHSHSCLMVIALSAAAVASGCAFGGTEDGGASPVVRIDDGKGDGVVGDAVAVLEVYALDVWAQAFPPGAATLSVVAGGHGEPFAASTVNSFGLTSASELNVSLSADDHEDLVVALSFDGTDSSVAVRVVDSSAAVGHGISLGHDVRRVAGRVIPVHTLYLGLRHKWFSASGRPARRGNSATLLMDGEEAWQAVSPDLAAATDSVSISTWWWESNFELLREPETHPFSTATERRPNTILNMLESVPATKRVIVGQFLTMDGIISGVTSDDGLLEHASTSGDDFEAMGQANPSSGQFWFSVSPFTFGDRIAAERPEAVGRELEPEEEIESDVPPRMVDLTDWPISIDVPGGSYHQKFAVIDSRVAYIGGMNLRRSDWDTSAHAVFEPRRMLFDATTTNRLAVRDKERMPDLGPRKDYMVRLEGPAAQDAADVFGERWSFLLESAAQHAENNTPFDVGRDMVPIEGGLQVQVTTTLPQPFWEHSIAETWFNAVSNAREFIYIEDQYFRIPMLVDAIIEQMNMVPELRLIVVTKPVDEWLDPGCEWTYKTHEELASRFQDRYLLLQLKTFDYAATWGWDETVGYLTDIDTHSKMLIVDDRFMSVGSANKNNRGIVYEGEMNVAVLDETWVRAARRRILGNMLPSGTPVSDDVAEWWAALEMAAEWNQAVWQRWQDEGGDIDLDGALLPDELTPRGFVYSLDFRDPSYCFLEGVGPDMT